MVSRLGVFLVEQPTIILRIKTMSSSRIGCLEALLQCEPGEEFHPLGCPILPHPSRARQEDGALMHNPVGRGRSVGAAGRPSLGDYLKKVRRNTGDRVAIDPIVKPEKCALTVPHMHRHYSC